MIARLIPTETSITIHPVVNAPGYDVVVRADERTATVHTDDAVEAQELCDLFELMLKFGIHAAIFQD